MIVLLCIAATLLSIALSACVVVFLYLLWETRRTLLGLNEAVAQFALITKDSPLLMEEAVRSLREIRTAVEGQASRRMYRRPGRREGEQIPDEPRPPEWQSVMDEIARQSAEVGNV